MANIAIVNYCNLKCPYCFAEDMIQEDNAFMSLENYNKLLDFILKSPTDRVGILGGEPTLHPQFKEILQITNDKCQDRKAVLFSNGIELEKFLPDLNNIGVLINYNDPKNLTNIQNEKLQKTIKAINELGWSNNKRRF